MMYTEESVFWRTWKVRLLTFAILTLAVCLTALPLWQKAGVQPILFLIILYRWSLYRPDLIPVEQLILISLIQDGIHAYPLGFSALRLLIDYTLLATQRRILSQQRFLWVWGGFGIFAFIDACVYVALLSCVKYEWVGILPRIPGLVITISLYPLTTWMINRYVMKRLAIS